MTYNIRGGLGMDNVRSIERVAAVIREAEPDLVALQEVHRRLPWSGMADQPRQLERLTGLQAVFRSSFSIGIGSYGNCWLTRLPVVRCSRHRLPGRPGLEPRAILSLDLTASGGTVRAFATHFGLDAAEKEAQAR